MDLSTDDLKAISNCLSDAFMYIGESPSEVGSPAYVLYQLLSLADEICDKYVHSA